MDILSSSSNPSDLSNSDKNTERINDVTNSEAPVTESIEDQKQNNQAGIKANSLEPVKSVNSVEIVNSAEKDDRTILNEESVVHNKDVNEHSNVDCPKDSIECVNNSESDSRDSPKLTNEENDNTVSTESTDSNSNARCNESAKPDDSELELSKTNEAEPLENSEDTTKTNEITECKQNEVTEMELTSENNDIPDQTDKPLEEKLPSSEPPSPKPSSPKLSSSKPSSPKPSSPKPSSPKPSSPKQSSPKPSSPKPSSPKLLSPKPEEEVESTTEAEPSTESESAKECPNVEITPLLDTPEEEKSNEESKESETSTERVPETSDLPKNDTPTKELPNIDIPEESQTSLTEPKPETPTQEETREITELNETNDVISEVDDQSMDQDMQQESVFVHVETKRENEEDKSVNSTTDLQNETADENEISCVAEEDPIGISQDAENTEKDDLMDFNEETSDKESIKVVEFSEETITSDKSTIDDDLVDSKGADEELCIIPDTEREISQEEKDAATAAAAAVAEKKDESSSTAEAATDAEAMETEDIPAPTTDALPTTTEEPVPATTDEEFMASVNNATIEATDKTQIKVIDIPEDTATEETCHQCCSVKKCLYKVDNQLEKATFLCSETCLISFRTLNKPSVEGTKTPVEGLLVIKDLASKSPVTDSHKIFVRKCAECKQKIKLGDEKVLSWETMDFCNEDCLSRHQNRIGSHCANCKKPVWMNSLGKYCVRFGHDIRQFCCSLCLEEFKKGLKVCSYCQKDISGETEGFLAPVGDKGQFKDFCSQHCMEKYEQMSNKANNNRFSTMAVLPTEIAQCAVCKAEKQVKVQFVQVKNKEDKKYKFCGKHCFIAFKFVNSVDPVECEMCSNYYDNDNITEFSLFYDSEVKNFCCKTCQNVYIIANRKIVPCSWCKVKKYNFDMIKRTCNNGQVITMCSLNCLSLFQVSVNAVCSKRMKCDYCSKLSQAQYHLTMSDATIRNFCTYQCVMLFQNQFTKLPITMTAGAGAASAGGTGTETKTQTPIPTSGPKKYVTRSQLRATSQAETATTSTTVNEIRMPVITNVESLAPNGTSLPRPNINVAVPHTTVKINSQQTQSVPQPSTSPKPQVKQHIIIKAPPLPPMKNAATSCKPIMLTKGVSCRPHPCSRETQTDEIKEKTVLVPVPVPIYVPAPLPMFSAPVPVPVPFPLPIPIPVFIPTTRNSAAGIMKEIKKIQVKIPTDPFEAELLMMAEMVAGEKKVDNTDSESEEDDTGDPGADGGFSPEAVDTSNTFGDDMLQMALKIATELDEPAVDLEGALTANTITASQNTDNTALPATEEAVDDPQPMHQLIDRQNLPIRGRKRPNRQPRNINNPAKRGRRMSSHVEMPLLPPPQPAQPPEPIEKPDANMCLKYTFGVNAWKQWVTTKNSELEKSSRRVKLFKNEILQLTADELNYSLCLFVKEVRKPNGTEYAPDTIYYLCLGIQQYLYENGRIDNIFTDAYYEKFTDCLDEVARKFSVLYNDSHYIVTRVEEEHLWESKQLGAHSPHVLLSTLMFFNTKHFNLTTVDEHMQLSFSHIMKHWKRNPNQPGAAKVPGSRNVLLRFYPPQTNVESATRKRKVYEQQENDENPLRCPVKLYEFYLSKCPESVKTRNDVFYLLPERSCVPDSPVWYSTMALGREALEKMLHRVKMVKEINVALLTS